MKWTVVWTKEAEDELADLWIRDDERAAITSAAYRIEHELRTDADLKGEDFYGDRIYQYGPLAVAFELQPDDRFVRVIQVMRIKQA